MPAGNGTAFYFGLEMMHNPPSNQEARGTERASNAGDSCEARGSDRASNAGDSCEARGERRHDLDALRAFAMLLGIGLHAALSFAPLPWVVRDTRQSEAFLVFFETIHGFRMPLFFIVSGFFTAMLWRQRGLKSLLRHRAKRIALPLAISLVTIVPATIGGVVLAITIVAADTKPIASQSLAAAVRLGDTVAIKNHLAQGEDLNRIDPDFKATPLTWASLRGDVDTVRLLLDAGADLEARNGDDGTALLAAAFAGRSEVVRRLLAAGADPHASNNDGVRAISTFADRSVTEGVSLSMGLNLNWETVEAGREGVRSQLETAMARSAPQTLGSPATATYASMLSNAPADGALDRWRDAYRTWLHSDAVGPWIYTPVFHHLWFLWFLCWLVVGFSACAWASAHFRSRVPRVPPKWVNSPLRVLWLFPLTLVAQLFMGVDAPMFGPDTSTGLLPLPHLLFYYAIFFGFGALYYDSADSAGDVGRWWWLLLPFALLAAYPIAEHFRDSLWPAAIAQVTYVWAMSFGLLGVFRKYLSQESSRFRYISDSSYWLYLAHLPFIFPLQALVRSWPLPAGVKFLLVAASVSGVLLVSYEYLVRYTLIGRLLNGPKVRPQRTGRVAPAATSPTPPMV